MKRKNKKLPCLRGQQVKLKSLIESPFNQRMWEKKILDKNSIIAVDLFCGAGGLSLGFERSGFFVAAALDVDQYSCETHAGNLLSKVVCSDISKIKSPSNFLKKLGIDRVDVLIGGPPCQGFSTEGRGKIRDLNLLDKYHKGKNLLYKHFVRFVKDLQPLYFLMENVPGMENFFLGNGMQFSEKVVSDFKAIGYKVESKLLDAVDFGVPQYRKRLFFQGTRINQKILWPNHKSTPLTLFDAIGDIPAKEPPCLEEVQKYESNKLTSYQSLMRNEMQNGKSNLIYDHIVRPVREDDKEIFKLLPEGGKYTDVPIEYRRYRSDIFKDKYRKLIWSKPSYTVTAHMSKDGYRYIHPDKKQLRTLSIREVARIQSFPDSFRFAGYRTNRYIQVGNAVPPFLSGAVAKCIKKSIVKSKKDKKRR